MSARKLSLLFFVVLLFASGASALIYQVLWLRVLSLVFGVTVYAATAVLASFMAGLAAGSAIAGRIAERVASPLRWFGVVEIGIGLLALATQPLFASAPSVFAQLHLSLPDHLLAHNALRFFGSFVLLLGPTTLMGMTWPLVLKAATTDGGDAPGRRISLLYAANTAGAVAGTLTAGFYLVGAFGMARSFALAAFINIAVGVVGLVLSFAGSARRSSPVAPGTAGDGVAGASRARLPRTATAVFAMSGFAALALEVVWFRVLVYFVPATNYAFSTMLAAVLLGLAAGSAAATRLLRREGRLLARLAWLQLATAFSVPVAAITLAAAYRAGWHTTADVHVSVILALPPTFLMGMSYPIGLHAWGGRGRGSLDATAIGDLNSANLLGGILGAVVGGFVVLPGLGSRVGLAALSAVYVVSFLLLVRHVEGTWRRRVAMAVAPLAFVAVAANLSDMVDVVAGRRYPASEQLFWSKEGAQTTAAVRVRPSGTRVLYLNGIDQASDLPEMVRLHRLIGHLPMAVHPNPRRAIVVGLGGGATPGAVSQHDTVVDVIELSPSVVESAPWFAHINYDVVRRPNVRMRVDDGRNFLLSTRTRYDVVTADVIQPEHAGAGNLYSREYFGLVRRVLAPGGLVLQWIGDRSDVEYKLMLRTFLEVFPETTVWAGGRLLIGSLEPLVVSRAAFERQLLRDETRQALEAIDLGTFAALRALFVAGPEAARTFVGPGPILTDDRPFLEYFRSLPPGSRVAVDISSLSRDASGRFDESGVQGTPPADRQP